MGGVELMVVVVMVLLVTVGRSSDLVGGRRGSPGHAAGQTDRGRLVVLELKFQEGGLGEVRIQGVR